MPIRRDVEHMCARKMQQYDQLSPFHPFSGHPLPHPHHHLEMLALALQSMAKDHHVVYLGMGGEWGEGGVKKNGTRGECVCKGCFKVSGELALKGRLGDGSRSWRHGNYFRQSQTPTSFFFLSQWEFCRI
jgi:hypothetical protein